MNHLERQPHNGVEEKLAYLRTTLNDMRQDQTFGASDVRTYVIYNQTSNIDITLTSLTTTTPQCIEITLTPNTLASNPVIAYDFSFNLFGPSGAVTSYRFDPLPPVGGVQKFRLYLIAVGSTTSSLGVGVSFWTISPATYTVAQVTP
ncbi:hypothetical protein AHiyo1_09580 [Arthrobacter sp. Hiyo1]|uniref:hypothetical protein n=1 Tax=Arthrobacter sp. Hiyo1 TaxID=1588020 RepID=UPI000723854B|nr:hypothetical protein [Arthrobacter sp. Hiyo1]GAP57996.1 hypothetical protein AHiyo1_09580 [Arthrobacter sp. Hiyo1]